ncbi:hypothetical protein GI374_09770 [Paracoccus sp. S-4012]|uniref:universal stress protein n=1 Tax=Paracoccus sp. S-4012 TaxID=2665648 RepID=UPI0012B03E09|nr:universal stress protein [Paracoccus sp. S-4012]MRX50727.1 hypothetical protein [Paracoccus sp. S-4012]
MTDGPVLVAIDPANLEGQRYLLARAEEQAAKRGTTLEAILVVEAPSYAGGGAGFASAVARLTAEAEARARDWLAESRGANAPAARARVTHGDAVECILREAKAIGASVIVMGERSLSLDSRLLGSAARGVSEQAEGEVVLVPTPARG